MPRCFHVRPARTSPPRGHWRLGWTKPSWKNMTLPETTPWKINGWNLKMIVWKSIFRISNRWFSGSMLIFQGVTAFRTFKNRTRAPKGKDHLPSIHFRYYVTSDPDLIFRKTHTTDLKVFFVKKKLMPELASVLSNERLSKKGGRKISFSVGGWTNPICWKICDRQKWEASSTLFQFPPLGALLKRRIDQYPGDIRCIWAWLLT